MKKTISIVLVLTFGLATEVAKADFTFGEPVNLGSTVNSWAYDGVSSIAANGLTLYFGSNRFGGLGNFDTWVTMRETVQDPWGEPVNLGPTVNSSVWDGPARITANGLDLYFSCVRPGGSGKVDLWVTTRASVSEPWGEPVNLGPTVNSSALEMSMSISTDGLSFIFDSDRSGGYGGHDLWVSTRPTLSESWGTPENLGSTVNGSDWDYTPELSSDGLLLFFCSDRSGGHGSDDIWLTRRETTDDSWGEPVNLGPEVNSSSGDGNPVISADGSTLYFGSNRFGGSGIVDIWQVSIEPVVDLNADRIVDAADMCIIVDHWGTNNSLCDIGPMPWGDGIVDVQDLIVLAEHLFEEVPPAE